MEPSTPTCGGNSNSGKRQSGSPKKSDEIYPGDDKLMSCTGIAYYSKAMKDAKMTPVCLGIKRTLPHKLPSENMATLDKMQKKNVIHSVCLGYSQCSGRMERLGNSPICLKGVPITVSAVPEAPRSRSSSSSPSSSSSSGAPSIPAASTRDSESISKSIENQQQMSAELAKLKAAVAKIGDERMRTHAEYMKKKKATEDPKELQKLKAEYLSKLDASQMKMKKIQEAVNRITDDYHRELIQQEKLNRQMQQRQHNRGSAINKDNENSESKEFRVVLSTDALYKIMNKMQQSVENGEMKKSIEYYSDFTVKACTKQYERLEKFYQNHGKEMPSRIYESGKKIIVNMPKTMERVGNVVSKFIDDITRK